MPEEIKRKRGAPKGNQNARKHGFYSRVLDEAEKLDFELAAGVDGIDDEIALLRVKIKSITGERPGEYQAHHASDQYPGRAGQDEVQHYQGAAERAEGSNRQCPQGYRHCPWVSASERRHWQTTRLEKDWHHASSGPTSGRWRWRYSIASSGGRG